MKEKLDIRLVLGLALLAPIRPFLSILGIADLLGKPLASLGTTLLLTLVWVFVAKSKAEDPLLTLAATGLVYGAMAIFLSVVLSPMILGQLQGPTLSIRAIISVLITNLLWGALAGLLAKVLQTLKK